MDGVRSAEDVRSDDAQKWADTTSDRVQQRAGAASDGARWMSFVELAAARGISRASASRLVRRRKWRRQTDNLVRILVPPEDNELPDTPMDIVRELANTFHEQAEVERKRADAAEAQAERAERRVDVAEARADRAEQRADAAVVDNLSCRN
jgi:hypothetical protein